MVLPSRRVVTRLSRRRRASCCETVDWRWERNSSNSPTDFSPSGENAENQQAQLLRQSLEEFARLARVLDHAIEFADDSSGCNCGSAIGSILPIMIFQYYILILNALGVKLIDRLSRRNAAGSAPETPSAGANATAVRPPPAFAVFQSASRQMRRALSWKSRARSASLQPRVIAWVAATHVESEAVRVQTGQSLPQTTRSQPKQPIACST